MTILASRITSLTVVYSIVYSGVNQRKHQSSASLAFVREIHRGPVNFPHKWPVTRKMFQFDDVIMHPWRWTSRWVTRSCIPQSHILDWHADVQLGVATHKVTFWMDKQLDNMGCVPQVAPHTYWMDGLTMDTWVEPHKNVGCISQILQDNTLYESYSLLSEHYCLLIKILFGIYTGTNLLVPKQYM